jgi:SynChlorMet cassette protein ScmC
MSQRRIFFLQLANGQCWQFMSDESCQGLTERLAALMQLGTVGPYSSPRLILAHDDPLPIADGLWRVSQNVSRLTEDIPRDGWRLEPMGEVRLMSHPGCADTICVLGKQLPENRRIPTMWPAFVPVFRKIRQAGGLVVHAGLLVRDEQGVLLVGPSGMGKSTCPRRIGRPWSALCDDQTLVIQTKEGPYRCHPLPTWSALWSDSRNVSWHVNRHVPLRAIFFLERSDVNRVESLGQGRAVALLSKSAQSMTVTRQSGTDRDEEITLKRKLFDNACGLVKSVPCFALHANLTTRFWEQMDSVM